MRKRLLMAVLAVCGLFAGCSRSTDAASVSSSPETASAFETESSSEVSDTTETAEPEVINETAPENVTDESRIEPLFESTAEETENSDPQRELLSYLKDYYRSRYNVLKCCDFKSDHEFRISETVADENEIRAEGLINSEKNAGFGAKYTNVVSNVVIVDVEEYDGYRMINAKEEVTVMYESGGHSDVFMFSVDHVIRMTDDMCIEEDKYDECLITGFSNV